MVEQIFELGNTTKCRCLGVRVKAHANLNGKSLESIRGRQATVDALIGNEHYPTIRRSQISVQSRGPSSSEQNPKIGHSTYLRTCAFWLQLPSSSSHKKWIPMLSSSRFGYAQWTWPRNERLVTNDVTSGISQSVLFLFCLLDNRIASPTS